MHDINLQFRGDCFQGKVIVVLLHALWADIGSGAPLDPMRVNTFENLVRTLAYEGYHFMSSEQMYLMYHGLFDPPQKSVYLTFDDGFTCAHYYGTPILQKYGARASISPEYNKLGNDSLTGRLSLSGLSDVYETGVWDIDTHGYVGHGGAMAAPYNYNDYTGSIYADRLYIKALSRYMTDEEHKDIIRADLIACKNLIEPITGKTIRTFPYPGGDCALGDENSPAQATFEVLDELGMIGYMVTGTGVTVVKKNGSRHTGVRPAWSNPKDIMSCLQVGTSVYDYIAIPISLIKVGEKYLVSSYDTLRWFNLDLTPDGEAFVLTGGNMGNNLKMYYDEANDEFWAGENFTVYKFNPYTGEILTTPVNTLSGEISTIFTEGDYVYVLAAQNCTLKRSLKSNLSFGTVGVLPGCADWGTSFSGQYIDGVLYILNSNYRAIAGFDINTLELVRKIHLPQQPDHNVTGDTRVFCPTKDIDEWIISRNGRIVKYRAD